MIQLWWPKNSIQGWWHCIATMSVMAKCQNHLRKKSTCINTSKNETFIRSTRSNYIEIRLNLDACFRSYVVLWLNYLLPVLAEGTKILKKTFSMYNFLLKLAIFTRKNVWVIKLFLASRNFNTTVLATTSSQLTLFW